MSRITITLGQKQKCNTIPIGRVGENIVTEVAFDFGQWAEEYGSGNITLVAQRNGDANPYPVTLTVSGTVAVWSITDADVAITGMGKAQVSYIVGEAVKKSDIYQTVCHNSLTGTGEAPDPYDDWMDALERLTAQNSAYAQQASESATNAFNSAEQAQEVLEEFESVTVSATTLPEGSSATASYADGHIAFGIPKGDTGAQGEQGEQGIQGIQGERGEQGLQGERGADGADGVTPDFSIGTVETLDAGSDATATITGTKENPVLNLGIPQGDPGEVTQAEFDALEKEIYNTSETNDSSVYMKRLTDNGELSGQKIMYENLKVVGGSLVWNQIVSDARAANAVYGITRTRVVDGSKIGVRYTGTCTYSTSFTATNNTVFTSGHKYFFTTGVDELPSGVRAGFEVSDKQAYTILTSYTGTAGVYIESGTTVDFVIYPQVIDLTALFGTTIADYIYSLEQSTAGAGVAWFKKYFPENYYPYSAPTLQSVNTSAHIMKDANDNPIGTYALDADLELRGMPKLDAENNLVYDGDVYEADGTVTRKYGIVDLGTLNWSYVGDYFSARVTVKPVATWNTTPNMLCSRYIVTYGNNVIGGSHADKVIGQNTAGTELYIAESSYTDAAAFKTAMSGVYLVYELATETTEQANPYTNPQHADADGTEEFVCSNTVPVGNITTYKVQSSKLPSPPTTDGTYTLTATVTDGVPRFTWEQ